MNIFMKFLFTIILFLFSISAYPDKTLIDMVAGIAGDCIVTKSDIKNFKKLYELRLEVDPFLEMSSINKDSEDKIILEYLTQECLISNEYPVSNEEVEQEISIIEKNFNITRNGLIEILKGKKATYEEYFYLIKISLSKKLLIERELRNRIYISPADIKNAYLFSKKQTSDLQFEYQIAYILIDPKKYKNEEIVSKRIQEALELLKKGTPFAEVVKEYSDDETTYEKGGVSGYYTDKDISKSVLDVLRRMKIGDISDVISSPLGYQIFKLLDVRSADETEFNEKKDKIGRALLEKAYVDHIKLWTEAKKQLVYLKINI